MFTIEMLPAGHGDCLWIEYGDAQAPRRMLIDCGTKGAGQRQLLPKVASLAPADRRFGLLVMTHIDADHIGGAIPFLARLPDAVSFADVWFNARPQLQPYNPLLGPKQGERVAELLEQGGHQWNH